MVCEPKPVCHTVLVFDQSDILQVPLHLIEVFYSEKFQQQRLRLIHISVLEIPMITSVRLRYLLNNTPS